MTTFYDYDGNPIPQHVWVELNYRAGRIVATTSLSDPRGRKWDVITMWLGVNLDPIAGTPQIYETRIAEKHDTAAQEPYTSARVRHLYATRTQAVAGHNRATRRIAHTE